MGIKENQRIKLTKQLLSDALLQMLQEMPIQSVSIRELCTRAGINRTTFYNHYGSQYELLNDISQRFLDEIAERLASADSSSKDSVQEQVALVFAYLADHQDLSVLLLNNSDSSFAERIFSLPKIADLLDASLKDCCDPYKKEAITSFAIHGSYRLLQEWINSDDRRSAEDEAALILELARRVCR